MCAHLRADLLAVEYSYSHSTSGCSHTSNKAPLTSLRVPPSRQKVNISTWQLKLPGMKSAVKNRLRFNITASSTRNSRILFLGRYCCLNLNFKASRKYELHSLKSEQSRAAAVVKMCFLGVKSVKYSLTFLLCWGSSSHHVLQLHTWAPQGQRHLQKKPTNVWLNRGNSPKHHQHRQAHKTTHVKDKRWHFFIVCATAHGALACRVSSMLTPPHSRDL